MAKSYRDLEIWQIGMEISELAYRVTANFPADERFGLTSQIRRAAVSIPTNIAEGWGRSTKANLANFVVIARGSANELESLVELAKRLKVLAPEDKDLLDERLDAFLRKSFLFLNSVRGDSTKEDSAPYGEELN